VLDSTTNTWIDTQIPPVMSIRSRERLDDPTTGRHLIFAGGGIVASPNHATAAGIYRGRMDATHPETGGIVWEAQEASGLEDRVMSFAIVSGHLYASDKTHVYVRTHDAYGTPSWSTVYTYTGYGPVVANSAKISGIRALTTVSDGSGTYMLAAVEYAGDVLRIVPKPGFAGVVVTTELNYTTALTRLWGSIANADPLAAYTDMPSISDPATGERVHLIGLLAMQPGHEARTGFLVRRGNGRYELHQIQPVTQSRAASSDPWLRGLRALAVHDNRLYAGGFDGSFLPDIDTGWIYARPLAGALDGGTPL
jgi:hypothetical protein